MRTTIRYLSSACAGALLLACAGLRPPAVIGTPAAPAPDTAGADGYYALGRQQHGARRYAEAQRAYRLALQLAPRHVNARNGLAVLHAEQGDYAKAMPIWQTLADEAGALAGPDAAFLLSNLGYAYTLQGEHEQAVTLLEKACLLDPLNARAWEHLAAALEHSGQGARAQLMLKQARALQTHDIRRDYALAGAVLPGAAAASAAPAAPAPTPAWPAAMARTEVTPAGAAMVQVRRVVAGAPAAARPVPAAARPAPATTPAVPAAALPATPAGAQRMEISNGNGVTGMAAALARTVHGPALQVVRLSNMPHFAVPRTRVEYRPEQQVAARALAARLGLAQVEPMAAPGAAGLRIVLGLDQRNPARLRWRYLQAQQQPEAAGVLAHLCCTSRDDMPPGRQ